MTKEPDIPEFREAIPTPSNLNDEGIAHLISAIILAAAHDYFNVCLHDIPKERKRYEENLKIYSRASLESFIDGEFYALICDIPPETFKRKIVELRKKSKVFPNMGNYKILQRANIVTMPAIRAHGNKRSARHMYGDFL